VVDTIAARIVLRKRFSLLTADDDEERARARSL